MTETAHEIPPITDPLGRYWTQPDRSLILTDDRHAVMAPATLLKLHDYSCTNPTGAYAGKMWRRRRDYYDESKGWLLCWFGLCDTPGYVSNHVREILLLQP